MAFLQPLVQQMLSYNPEDRPRDVSRRLLELYSQDLRGEESMSVEGHSEETSTIDHEGAEIDAATATNNIDNGNIPLCINVKHVN